MTTRGRAAGALLILLFTGTTLSQVANLDLRLTSEGKPVAARVYLTDGGGHSHRIPAKILYSRFAEQHWIVDGAVQIPVSPGIYKLRVEKGPEYTSVERKIEIGPAQTQRVDVEISRRAHMNSEGWYSGDMHIHREPSEMPMLLRAEDLNVGPVITRHVGVSRKPPPYPETDLVQVDDSHVIGLHVQEVERNQQGHGAVILLNDPHPVSDNLSLLFPTVAALGRQAKANGAFVDAEKPIWRNVPINVAFGLVDSIGVVNNHFHPHEVTVDAEEIGAIDRDKPVYYRSMEGFALWMMSLYYSYLIAGTSWLRPPARLQASCPTGRGTSAFTFTSADRSATGSGLRI